MVMTTKENLIQRHQLKKNSLLLDPLIILEK